MTSIRLAQKTDVNALVDLENAVFDSDLLSKAQFYYHLRSLKNRLYVAYENQQITGYILLFVHRYSARIYSLTVAPAHQRKGIAYDLIKHATHKLPAHISRLYLEVNINNAGAIHLYHKVHFAICQTIPNYYPNGDSAYRMNKALSAT